MPRKKPDQGIDESNEKFKPHTAKLARWLKSTIEQHDLNVNAFVKKAQSRDSWSLPSSTFYQICRAQAVMSPDTAKKTAYWLKRLYNVKVDYTDLLNLIEDTQPEEMPPPRIERDILPPTTIDWHFQRLPVEERITIWPSILNRAGKDFQVPTTAPKDFPVGRRAIDEVIRMIHAEASRRKITSARELARSILKDDNDDNPAQIELAMVGFHQILVERRWPYQDTQEYEVLIPALAKALHCQSVEELQECLEN